MFSLKGKRALVTGAASGIGEGIAHGYAAQGAAVALVDVDAANAERVAQQINGRGGRSLAIVGDVSQEAQVERLIAESLEFLGDIDILVNSAGVASRSPAEQMPLDIWDKVLRVNLTGPFLMCRQVGRQMISQGLRGRIINISSVAGLVGLTTGIVNYSASKGGLVALTRCLAAEWAPHGILVNTIAPSHIETPLDREMLEKKPEIRDYFIRSIPLGRIGQVEDVVGPAIFLASDAASFVTGHVLIVDGGHTAV